MGGASLGCNILVVCPILSFGLFWGAAYDTKFLVLLWVGALGLSPSMVVWAMEDAHGESVQSGGSPVFCSLGKVTALFSMCFFQGLC